MIPFSGFLQASSSPTLPCEGIGGQPGTRINGLAAGQEVAQQADDNGVSFLAWVNSLMGSAGALTVRGDSVLESQLGRPEANTPELDRVNLPNNGSIDHPSTGSAVLQSQENAYREDAQNPVSPNTVSPMVAHDESGKSADHHHVTTLPAVSEMLAAKGDSPIGEGQRPFANAPHFQTTDPLSPTQAGYTDNNSLKEIPAPVDGKEKAFKNEHPFDGGLKAPASINKNARADIHYLFNPTLDDNGKGDDSLARWIHQQSSFAPERSKDRAEVASIQQQVISSQTKASGSAAIRFSNQNLSSSDQDTDDHQDAGHPRQAQRIELADINENKLIPGRTSEATKSNVSEPIQPTPTAQETVKTTADSLATQSADKSSASQTSAPTRPLALVDRSFQTAVMDQIIDKASLRTTQGHSEVQIRLKPEFLGNVKMTIATDKEQVMVRVVTDQPMVKEIIETHLHQLKTELQNQGLTIDKFDVMVNADADHHHSREQFAQMFKQHSSQNDRRQPQEQHPETAHPDNGHESDSQQPDREGVNYFA